MTPQQLGEIENKVHALDEEYWNGTDQTVTDALNDLADLVGGIRDDWMNTGDAS